MIYFLQAADHVKIGHTRNEETLQRRIATLQIGQAHKLVVVRVIPGDRAEEAWLHAFFGEHRLSGEWFRFHASMLTVDPPSDCPPVGGAFVVIRLPRPVYSDLVQWAHKDYRTPTGAAVYLLKRALKQEAVSAVEPDKRSDKAA